MKLSGEYLVRYFKQIILARIIHAVYMPFYRIYQRKVSDIYIFSHPKNGRTKLRTIIGKYICDKYGLDDSRALDIFGITKEIKSIPTICMSHGHFLDLEENTPYLYKNKKILMLVRNTKDTLVSYYYDTAYRHPAINLAFKKFEGNISEFIHSEKYGIYRLLRFHRIWSKLKDISSEFLLISFRDLKKDTRNTIIKTLKYLEIDIDINNPGDNELLEKAIEFGSFKKMREMELNQEGPGVLKPGDKEKKETWKCRSGKVGGYVDELSEEDIQYIENAIKEDGHPFPEAELI